MRACSMSSATRRPGSLVAASSDRYTDSSSSLGRVDVLASADSPLAASALFQRDDRGQRAILIQLVCRSIAGQRFLDVAQAIFENVAFFRQKLSPFSRARGGNLLPDRAAAANLATFPVGNKCDAAPTDWAVAPGRAGAPPHSLGLRRYPPAQCARARRRFRAEAPPLDRGLFRRATDVPARRCGRGRSFWLDAGSIDRIDGSRQGFAGCHRLSIEISMASEPLSGSSVTDSSSVSSETSASSSAAMTASAASDGGLASLARPVGRKLLRRSAGLSVEDMDAPVVTHAPGSLGPTRWT